MQPDKRNFEGRILQTNEQIKLSDSYPNYLNWTEKGAVTSIKDQGSCNSCWAFGAIATAESTKIIKG